MATPHLPFVDWLKAVGLSLIVYGHVAAATTVAWTPPVYPKQLGVAFFVFVTGFTLANEHRPAIRVVLTRYFEVFFFGLTFALLMSLVGALWWSDPNESNYLPLLLGANVFVNAFPANPSTWYLGTYLHLLLLWALLFRNLRITGTILLVAFAAEISARTFLIGFSGRFVAYMMVTNWMTVLLFGLFCGHPDQRTFGRKGWSLAVAVLVPVAWPMTMRAVPWDHTFPFMTLSLLGGLSGGAEGVLASVVYLAMTAAAYTIALQLPNSRAVTFLARNSLLVFIAHMPIYYLLEYLLRPMLPAFAPRAALELLVCLPGLALVSDVVRKGMRLRELSEKWSVLIHRCETRGLRGLSETPGVRG